MSSICSNFSAEAERDRLLAQVGELAAGDLVVVDAAGRRRQARLERRVEPAHGLPVGLEVADRLQVEAGVALGVLERGDQRRQRRAGWWCRPSRRWRRRRRPTPASTRGQQRGELAARGVVGVQVHRQVEPLAQRGDQRARRRRAAAARPCP